MEIRRYLTQSNLERMAADFGFLVEIVRASQGELDLALRDDYFNVYYQGNSLAKVTFLPTGDYELVVHISFLASTSIVRKFSYETGGGKRAYAHIRVKPKRLRTLLQKTHIQELQRSIREVNYGEEITFEQLLIADNPPSEGFIIIDRQVTDSHMKGKRLDLLALQQVDDAHYRFVVIEVKLGKNTSLKENVAAQLEGYLEHVGGEAFSAYKDCYERNYAQKHHMGLLTLPHEAIDIVNDVRGLVVVGGNSSLGAAQIAQLKAVHAAISVKQFRYELTDDKGGFLGVI